MIRLKSLKLRTGVIQAPMAGCTDLAFRLLARSYGMEFAYLEMISADALVRKNKKTLNLLKKTSEDKPLGAQLFGSKPEILAKAAAIIEELGFDLVDINLGCPVAKITRGGSGAALLRKPELVKEIFRDTVKSIRQIPVTAKLRKGYSDQSGREALEIAHIAQEEGLAAIAVHGRLCSQGYTGKADWEIIGRVKRSVSIPVFGNGDITSGEDAKRMLASSGCDGIMIGRGALGNPWIYQSVEAALNGASIPPPPTLADLEKAVLKHVDLEILIEGQSHGTLKCRKIVCWYFKNFPGAAAFRNRVFRAQNAEDLREGIINYCRELIEKQAPIGLPPGKRL